jgi:peroxiredoxin Q/BCP
MDSHRRFREALNLPFHLLSDPDFKVAAEWNTAKTGEDGGTPTGIRRGHYVIDEQGKIVDAQTPVKAAESAKLALEQV